MNTSLSQPERCASSLSRLINQAPYLARCSDNKTAMLVRPREYAIRWPYMQVNRKDMLAWMVFDIDHEHRAYPNPYLWQDEGLPPPNLIVRNRASNKAHLFYAIVPVCTSDQARLKPIRYFKAIYHALALRLEADASYAGPVAKTPFHPRWQTTELHRSVYELRELADSLELEPVYVWRRHEKAICESRNCTLFEYTRQYAYSIVGQERAQGCYARFRDRVERFARHHNHELSGRPPLPYSEVSALIKSVARWTWDKYVARKDCQRGIMKLNASLAIQEKQRRAAKRTHRLRRERTGRRILQACKTLLRQNQPLTITLVAQLAHVCRQTIRRYRYLLVRAQSLWFVQTRNVPKVDVTYAVHQITAPKVIGWARYTTASNKSAQKEAFP